MSEPALRRAVAAPLLAVVLAAALSAAFTAIELRATGDVAYLAVDATATGRGREVEYEHPAIGAPVRADLPAGRRRPLAGDRLRVYAHSADPYDVDVRPYEPTAWDSVVPG